MSDSFVTQCPHCQTRFRVTHHQLGVARGVVRCGACMQMFNAAKQLLDAHRAQGDAATGEPAVAPAVDTSAPASVTPAPATPVAPAHDWTHSTLDEVDLDEELARLEQRDRPVEARDSRQAVSLHARRDEHRDEPQDERPFGTASDDADEPVSTVLDTDDISPRDVPALFERDEPTLSLEAAVDAPADTAPPRLGDLRDTLEPSAPLGSLSAVDDEETDDRLGGPSLAADDADRIEPGLGQPLPEARRKEPLIDVVDDPLRLDWQKPKPNWRKRILWSVLTLLALGGLALQYVIYHFDALARQDQYRPLFQSLCPALGCQVPTRVDIERIKSSNLVVRSHPDFKGALIVDAIIYNRAPFAQPFPLLELRFADLNGQLIASRRFKPTEYLSGELAGRGDMPSQTPIHIALDILDPGPNAVNYSLSFRSPQ